MELDWYNEKLSPYAVLSPTPSSRWLNFVDYDRQLSPRWLSFLNLMQERKSFRGDRSGDESSPSGRNVSSPSKLRDPQCRRALSAGDEKCSGGSPSSLSPSPSKSHICFGCVLHSYPD